MAILTPHLPAPTGDEQRGGRGPRRWWLFGLVTVLAATGLVIGLLVTTSGNAPQTTPSTQPTTTAASGTTTSAPATTVPALVPNEADAVYPSPGSGTRFADPVPAARSFASDFVGFARPVLGRFVATGVQTGTVAVRSTSGGAVTTVRLAHIAGSWWVLGASTPHIRLDAPVASGAVASPMRLRGMSTAFEAQVNVEVREDGQRTPIGTGRLVGGSMGVMAPFDASVAFGGPSSQRGALVLFTVSMKDGTLYEATVVRVAFVPAATLVPASACPNYTMERPTAPAGEMVVTVFYSCGVDGPPVPTYRLYPPTTAVLRTALDQLFAGPSAQERAAGLTSWFSTSTAGYVRSVTLSSGKATVDLADLRPVIPNASASAGSHLLLAQLDATVFQFATVTSVIYEIDGSCQTFGEWLQLNGCIARTR
ncbi:MAG TPA: Gmad2 immunoglobulin-like domain-containing protein [Acidimicrobiia bacterium]|nr:Gmad2 immunoglobulin-like domain-containing protein [Acidimicrobiia bacterium]